MESERIWEEDTFTEIKEKLIEENRKYWANKRNITQGDKWIYVYHGMSGYHFDWAVHEDIVAKGLQEKTRLPVISVIDGFGRALPDGLDGSFGITDTVHLFYSKYVDERSERTTYEFAKALAEETYQDKDKLLQLEYRGIKFGDELYDDLLLRNWKNDVLTFDCFDISLEEYARCIRNALSLIDHAFALFSQKCPAYVITTERVQLKRLFGNIARTFGAEEIVVMSDWPEILVQIPTEVKRKITVSSCWEAAITYYSGQSVCCPQEYDDLFVIKHADDLEKYDLCEQLGISNHNKNVFILPHAFIDAPRGGSQLHFYHDYLEWFLKTIEIIRKIPNVNWIIKDHPMTAYYKQDAFVKKVFLDNKTPNMYWCDYNVSGMRIKEIADCVVTCGGEAALEYWAYGIPTITTAMSYFIEQGISYNMKMVEEYEQMLKSISTIEKPSNTSSKKAIEILCTMKQMSNCETQDELVSLFLETRKIQLANYFSGFSFRHIQTFCERYLDLLKRDYSFDKSSIYKLENVCLCE